MRNKEYVEKLKNIEILKNKKRGKRGRKKQSEVQENKQEEKAKDSEEDEDEDMEDDESISADELKQMLNKNNKTASNTNIFDIGDFQNSADKDREEADDKGVINTLDRFVKKQSVDKSKQDDEKYITAQTMELEAKLLRAGNINRLNIFSNSDNTETNEEKKQERKITKKHLIMMLESDPKYSKSDILFNAYIG